MQRSMRWTLAGGLAAALSGCQGFKSLVVEHYPNSWDDELGVAQAAQTRPDTVAPTFSGADQERPQYPVALQPLITGLAQPTDVQFPPGHPGVAIVSEKEGKIRVFDIASTAATELGTLLSLSPPSTSEQGVLGIAFHPTFGAAGGRMYVHHTVTGDEGNAGRISVTELAVRGTGVPEMTKPSSSMGRI